MQAGIVFIALIPLALVSVSVTVIAFVTTGDGALATLWGMATILLFIVIVMLTVEFRLLLTPVIVLRRGVKVGKAAECSNSIIGYHKKEVRPLYAFAVIVPRLMHAGAVDVRRRDRRLSFRG
ncbi:MAG: hypothetical protein MI724_01065 [Spirochaetales bacterium]|nr:hypothetical protein [Spirochaetales bacterium]